MNRRNFIRLLASSAIAAHELDIDRLLWVPGAKKIFVPESPKIYQPIPGTYGSIVRSEVAWNWGKSFEKVCIRISPIEEVEGY